MKDTVRVFKCKCEGNKFLLAGRPEVTPSLKTKREHGDLIAKGCTVVIVTIDQFRSEGWEYCINH